MKIHFSGLISNLQRFCVAGLEGCTRLQRIEVPGNELEGLEALCSCRLLLHLNASSNRLLRFPKELASPLLTSLSLRSNRQLFKALNYDRLSNVYSEVVPVMLVSITKDHFNHHGKRAYTACTPR